MGEKVGQRPAPALVGPLLGAPSGTGQQVAPAGAGGALRVHTRGTRLGLGSLNVSQP